MPRFVLALGAAVVAAAAAQAQGGYPGYPSVPTGFPTVGGYPYAAVQPPGGFMPNYYNRQSQPLSPYLNLLRGGNLATNYFFGVQPGISASNIPPAVAGPPVAAGSQLRTGFLPAGLAPPDEPLNLPEAGARITALPSSGHRVTYGGTGRYFPGSSSAAAPRTGITASSPPQSQFKR